MISVVAVGMCVCWGVISAVAFACIFVFVLVASRGVDTGVGGWSCSLSVRAVGAHAAPEIVPWSPRTGS